MREEAKLTLKGGETGIKRIRVARNYTVPFPLPSSPGPAPSFLFFKKERDRRNILYIAVAGNGFAVT